LPEEELRLISAALAAEINDEHLVILDVLGQGGFGTVSNLKSAICASPQKLQMYLF
jgi:hypothetical protein